MERNQVFGIVTYDALFKWVMSSDSVRPSFFHAFIPDIVVRSSERLDDHMLPFEELQLIRKMVHEEETRNVVAFLKENGSVAVNVANRYDEKATKFLKEILKYFDDIRYAFPKPPFNGTMDFVCRLDSGEFALVEMQVMPEDHWDHRALAYIAAFYGNQLRRGLPWSGIKKVIGVNILGGHLDHHAHWKETPHQYMRHYKFQEQIHDEVPPRFLEGMELFQYSLANAPKTLDSRERSDWLLFLKNAHNMSEKDVQREIQTPAVLEAFERAKLTNLPEKVMQSYEDQEVVYANLATLIAEQKAEGVAEGVAQGVAQTKSEVALVMLEEGVDIAIIQKVTGFSNAEMEPLLNRR